MGLAKDLELGKFGELWNYTVHEETIEAIWDDGDRYAELVAVVGDPAASPLARFVAAEVLFDKDLDFIGEVGIDTVAHIYATALEHNLTGMANSWGLLYEHGDAGPVGIRFEMLGAGAIPALRPLLDDATPGPTYEGSEEATVGNGYRFRIKDFAAYYAGEISGHRIPLHEDPAARDRAIEGLKGIL